MHDRFCPLASPLSASVHYSNDGPEWSVSSPDKGPSRPVPLSPDVFRMHLWDQAKEGRFCDITFVFADGKDLRAHRHALPPPDEVLMLPFPRVTDCGCAGTSYVREARCLPRCSTAGSWRLRRCYRSPNCARSAISTVAIILPLRRCLPGSKIQSAAVGSYCLHAHRGPRGRSLHKGLGRLCCCPIQGIVHIRDFSREAFACFLECLYTASPPGSQWWVICTLSQHPKSNTGQALHANC